MVDLNSGRIIMHYSSNVKINVVQQTLVNSDRYFRTESAMKKGLNWAIKASSFTLPDDDAPLEPSELSTLNSITSKRPRRSPIKQKNIQKVESSKSGESSHTIPKKVGKFKRFLERLKG